MQISLFNTVEGGYVYAGNKVVWDYFASIASHHLPTGLHSVRVGISAKLVGERLGLDGLLLYEMGLVHDAGKTVVPVELLSIEGRSPTKDEFYIIKKHTRAGYDLLKEDIPLHACIAGKHHPSYAVPEYPAVLSAGEHVLVDRCVPIITLCDFYDALMTRHNTAYKFVDRRNIDSIRDLLEKNFPNQKDQIDIILGNTVGPFVRKKRSA